MTKAKDIYEVAELMAEALEPFAEHPDLLDNYRCHQGMRLTKYTCIRCSKAIAAWEALKEYRNVNLEPEE